jgi:hypothetical protein
VTVTDPGVLEFGDRAGSCVALVLFGSLLAILGVGVWREIRRRAPERRLLAVVVGALLFSGPMALIYASSLNGFYEAEIRNDLLVLHYLHPARIQLALADVEDVRVAPAFRGRWRLHVVRTGGAEYESATWHRDRVHAAAERLRQSVQTVR